MTKHPTRNLTKNTCICMRGGGSKKFHTWSGGGGVTKLSPIFGGGGQTSFWVSNVDFTAAPPPPPLHK